MDAVRITKLFEDTAFIRTGGSPEELKAAEYLKAQAQAMGMEAHIEAFPVSMSHMHEAVLTVDGRQIACKGYYDALCGEIEAPLYYARADDVLSLSLCKDKIVMIDGYMGYWRYQDLLAAGAVGFITYDGDANYTDRDIDQRELRPHVHKGNRLAGVNINVKDAIELIRIGAKTAKIVLKQDVYEGESHNVVAEIPGERDEWIVLSAHYDSTSLSQGAYDNMSGSVGLLGIAEHFVKQPCRYGLRFVWCGSEERGLLGSKAYCEAHKEELDKIVMNINLDMIGCIMGKFIYCATTEEQLCHYIEYFGREQGFPITGSQDVYPSDATPFADHGVPAVSFARLAAHNCATIHNSYDTMAVMSAEQMVTDIDFLTAFTARMANAVLCPVKREIPDNMKDKLDEYMCRKRPAKKH